MCCCLFFQYSRRLWFCHIDFRLSIFLCAQILLMLNQCAPDFDVFVPRFNGHNSLLQCVVRLITMLFPFNVCIYFQSDQIKYRIHPRTDDAVLRFYSPHTGTHRNLNIIQMGKNGERKKSAVFI